MRNLWNIIREMFNPVPFNPIMQPEDLVCTHEGSSSCPVNPRLTAFKEYRESKDPRVGVMSFANGGETVWPN